MKFLEGLRPARVILCWTASAVALAQAPTPTPIPGTASASAPLRVTDPPIVTVARLPEDDPFGTLVESPAALPPKPAFTELAMTAPLYAAVRVDRTGKVTQAVRARDPLPSLAAESKRSFERWVFEPARKNGQLVETWASVRLDLQVEVKPPRIEQITLTPVIPSTPLPSPFVWGTDEAWYEQFKPVSPSDGTVPVDQLDLLATPKKTKWDAGSYKGPFSCRFWVKVSSTGRIDKSIPLQVSDPILIAYMRRQMSAWQLRPARVKGEAADSWNDLLVSGQIGYSVDIKQIANLRKPLAGS